jgi:dTDP-4-amino-4,6-dideoxygalactose transaminase
MLAAFLWGQLEARDHIQAKRKRIWDFYYNALKDWASKNAVGIATIPDYCRHPYHMFYIVMPSHKDQKDIIRHLRTKGIHAVFHYLPLHLSEMGKKMGGKKGDCPVTEDVSERLVRLPFYNELLAEQQEYIVDAVLSH